MKKICKEEFDLYKLMKNKFDYLSNFPVYNSANYILECLESIKIQTIQNFELILIDDKSTDKSPEIILRII